MNRIWRHLGLGAALAAAALLAACGGGGGSGTATGNAAPAAAAATIGNGTITGFGSIIVDGQEYDSSIAQVTTNNDPAHPVATPLSQLALGEQVDLTLNASGQLTGVAVVATVIGPVTTTSNITCPTAPATAGSMVIAGQTIDFTVGASSGNTVLEGVGSCSALATLATGTILDIHGALNESNDHVSATRIQVEPAAGAMVRVRGHVRNLNNGTFTIGALTVNTSSTTAILPAGATLIDGEVVRVFANALPTNGAITATTIQVENPVLLNGKTIVRGGLVSVVNSDGTFDVDGIKVDPATGKPTITDNTGASIAASSIAVGDWVRVKGTVTNGVLVASSIVDFKNGDPRPTLLIGSVGGLVSNSSGPVSFQVRGQTVLVTVSGTTATTFVNGTATSLTNGALVTVIGHITGAGIVATTITFDTPPQGVTMMFTGKVSGVGTASSTATTTASAITFSLAGLDMSTVTGTTGATTCSAAAPNSMTASTATCAAVLTNGNTVSVTGSFNGSLFIVSTAIELPPPPVASVTLSGTITCTAASGSTGSGSGTSGGTTTASCGSFTLAGATVNLPSNLAPATPLMTGADVVVQGTVDANGVVTATRLTVLNDGTTAHALGTIDAKSVTTANGVTTFTVGGQPVVVNSSTVISPGTDTVANLVGGQVVLVVGTLAPASGGSTGPEVITATSVQLL